MRAYWLAGRSEMPSGDGDGGGTAGVIAELLDDEVALGSGDGACCHGGAALSREGPAAFLHGLVLSASACLPYWLARP